MSNVAVASPSSFLIRATDALRNLGLAVSEPNTTPIASVISVLAEVDEPRAIVVARTIAQQQAFDLLVAEQVGQMDIGNRFEDITKGFDGIRDDAKRMVDQMADGRISFGEKATNAVMRLTRGDIPDRFDSIRKTYLSVTEDVGEQIEREGVILSAYRDFRSALKESEILALEIQKGVEVRVADAKAILDKAVAAIEGQTVEDPIARARLEQDRDQALHAFQTEDRRYQVAKDLADNLKVSFNVTEVTMARLVQSHEAKERVWQQSVVFFNTNTTVMSALRATFNSTAGLNEGTRTLNEMKEGMSKSLETIAEIGGKVQEAALEAGYGPTIRADAVKKLVDSVVEYQENSGRIIAEMRARSTENAEEIRRTVEEGKRRLTAIATKASALAA
jgi:hypothetical protein